MPERSWLGLLRGMNIGSRRLTNDELVAAVHRCGCSDVAAYQASGNIVFNDGRPEEELSNALTDGLARALGYPVPVFLRKASEVRTIAAATPFTGSQLAASRSKPQVVFLHAQPPEDVLLQAVALAPEEDVVVAAGRELYWLPASGVADSALDFRRLDQLTGGTTVRTMGTLQRLAGKYL